MSGRFAEVHTRSLSHPESFWAEAAEAIHWTKRWERVLDDSNPPSYRWFTGGELNTCYNALDIHVETGRGDQPALIYDSPVTGNKRRYSYSELRDEVARFAGQCWPGAGGQGRSGHRLHADGPRGDHRDARLRSARGGALGGVRRLRRERARGTHRRCDAGGDRLGIVRHRAGSGGPLQAAARRRHRSRRPQAERLRHPPARNRTMRPRRGTRRRLGGGHGERRAARLRVGRGHRSPLHPLHLRHHRPAQGRGPGQRRSRRRPQVDDEAHLRGRARRGVLGRVRRRLGGRALLHLLRAAAETETRPSCTRASPSALPTRARSGGCSPSTAYPCSSPRRPRSAQSGSRTPTVR